MLNTPQIEKGADTIKKLETTNPTLLIIDDDESVRKVMTFRLNALRKKLASLIVLSRDEAQPKPCVRLRIMLKLRGIDSTDTDFEIVTATENLSATGFLCGCTALIGLNTIVEVFLATGSGQFTGKARVTLVDSPGTVGQRCDFEFVEKPIDWILQ